VVEFPGEARFVSLFRNVQTGCTPTQSPIQFVPGAVSVGVSSRRNEADQSPTSSEVVTNIGAIPAFLHIFSWLGAYLSPDINLPSLWETESHCR
jgi:hypothetical protein